MDKEGICLLIADVKLKTFHLKRKNESVSNMDDAFTADIMIDLSY